MRRDETKSEYYLRRADFEGSAAERSSDPQVRTIHAELAGLYRARAAELKTPSA